MADTGTPTYSIVTTCKGRLDDLKRSLPRMVRQKDCEVIVVDYDCPQDCGDFVEREYPEVKIARALNRPQFNLPEARNIGAKLAGGDILVFLDADVLIADKFLPIATPPQAQHFFGTFEPKNSVGNSLRGSCLIKREDFTAIEGYDELLSGWMGEDLDIYMRLRVHGARRFPLDESGIENVIEQTTEERLRFRPDEEKRKQFLRGQLYQMAKEALMRARGLRVVELDRRKDIMQRVDAQLDAVFAGEKDFELSLLFPDKYRRGMLSDWEFASAVTVYARRKPES